MGFRKTALTALTGVFCLALGGSAQAITGSGSMDGSKGGFGEPAGRSVSATGAAVATIPFELLKARGGAQPVLGLSYNSNAGNRDAGIGWGLYGVDVITRGGAHGNRPKFDDSDWFYLNGEPLVPSPLPACGPGVAAPQQCYRPQTNVASVRVIRETSKWTIQTTGGLVTELEAKDGLANPWRWVVTRR